MLKGQSRGRRKDGAASPPVSVLRATKKPTTEPVEVGKHLVVDPRVCHGKLTFQGTRVPVHTVLVFMSKGWTIDQVLADWDQLKREAVVEAIELAADALEEGSLAAANATKEQLTSAPPTATRNNSM